MGYHFVAFFQDGLMFRPFENGATLAEAILQNLSRLDSLVERVTLVSHRSTDADLAKLLNRFGYLKARVVSQEKIMEASIEYPRLFLEWIKADGPSSPSLPYIVLDPRSTFLDPDLVVEAERYFRKQDLLVMTCSSALGWEVRLISDRREDVKSLMDAAWSQMEVQANPWGALGIVNPAKYDEKKYESIRTTEKNPYWTSELFVAMGLKSSVFAWETYATLQKMVGGPLRDIRTEALFRAASTRREELLNFPTQVELELTTHSSVVPIYSPLHHKRESIQTRGGHMEEKVFETVLRRIAEGSIPAPELIFSCATGDPLDHPRIVDWMGKLCELPPMSLKGVIFYTYGGGLTEAVSKGLMDLAKGVGVKKVSKNRVQVIVRLDAVQADVYRRVRNGVDFEQVMGNVDGLLRARKEHCWDPETTNTMIEIAVTTTLLEETQDHIDKFMERWPSLSGLQTMMEKQEKRTLSTPAGRQKFMELIRADRKVLFARSNPVDYTVIYGPSHFAGQIPVKPVADYTPLKRTPCRRLTGTLTILCDGRVVICDRVLEPREDVVIGRMEDYGSLVDAWRSETLSRLRQMHNESKYDGHPLCSRCGDWYIPL